MNDSNLLIWILITVIGLGLLRFVLKVTWGVLFWTALASAGLYYVARAGVITLLTR